jgi:hypothetical protein
MLGVLSDERTGLSFTAVADPRQHSHCQVSPIGLMTIFLLSQIRGSHNLEGQVTIFLSPRNGMAQLYSQALSSLFVMSYDSGQWWKY